MIETKLKYNKSNNVAWVHYDIANKPIRDLVSYTTSIFSFNEATKELTLNHWYYSATTAKHINQACRELCETFGVTVDYYTIKAMSNGQTIQLDRFLSEN